MKTRNILFLIIILNLSFSGFSANMSEEQTLDKETYIYSIKGKDTLRLDKYEPTIAVQGAKPCVMFVFGGGFYSGTRDMKYYIPYFDFLTGNCYTVISIDYRLGFRQIDTILKMNAKGYRAMFENAIFMAVEDLFDATLFLLEHAEEWNINKEMIVASGSSAGGITVLQGEYEISAKGKFAQKLPANFNYAGIISFAGAIYSMSGKLKWTENTSPIQLFHGDADKRVPYNKIQIFNTAFFGSKNIAQRLDKYNLPYYFYSEENTDHRVAVTPMYVNKEEMLTFLDKFVAQKGKLKTHVSMDYSDRPKVKKNFTIFSYIKTNSKSKEKKRN